MYSTKILKVSLESAQTPVVGKAIKVAWNKDELEAKSGLRVT